MTTPEIIQALTGPFSSMILAVIMLTAGAKWLGKYVPLYLNRHLDQIDKMVESHNEDREAWKSGLLTLTDQHNILARDVTEIKQDVKEIRTRA